MPRPRKPASLATTPQSQLGQEIRYWRERRGLTVAQLAAAIERDRRTVSAAEEGRDRPSEATVNRIEAVLDSSGLILSFYEATLAENRRRRLNRGAHLLVASPSADPADESTFEGETVDDGTLMVPGQRFVKTWTIRNAGSVAWRGRFLRRIGIASGPGLITTPDRIRIGDTAPGETVQIAVPCIAHHLEGTSRAVFKMADDEGRLFFLDRYTVGLQVQITVVRWLAGAATD